MSEILFNFDRPIGQPCKDCGYPFAGSPDHFKFYRLRPVDCLKHMPAHWKFHEARAYEEAMRKGE